MPYRMTLQTPRRLEVQPQIHKRTSVRLCLFFRIVIPNALGSKLDASVVMSFALDFVLVFLKDFYDFSNVDG